MDGSHDGEPLEEVLEGEVVLPAQDVVPGRPGTTARIISTPVVQTAAVAAGGFVAGMALVGFVSHRRSQRALASAGSSRRPRGLRRARATGELVQIVGTRSLLVDVHLLDGSGGPR